MFCSIVFGKWLDFPEYLNDNLLLNYIFQHEVKQVQNNDVFPPIREYFWRALYRRLVNVISRHEVAVMLKKKIMPLKKKTKKIDSLKKIKTYNVYGFVWSLMKKDPLVILRGLSLSKIGKFEKGDYGALFVEWSNPFMCMAPTSTELLQPWLIHSIDYFRTLLVDRQPNDRITISPHGNQQIICNASMHDPQFVQQSKQVVESVSMYTSEELVAEYHSTTTSVKLIENVRGGDQSIVLKELAAVKQRMNAIERFIKSKSDNMSEDLVAKQSVEKRLKLLVERPESSISDVLNGELSFDKNICNISQVESSKNEALSEEIDPKEYDKNVHESGDGKVSEGEIINVLTGKVSCDKYVGGFYDGESSKLYYTDHKECPSLAMTQLIEASEYAGFDFDNTENDSLSDMVKIGKEEIHLDGLKIVYDPFFQTLVKQNYEGISMYVNEINVVNENEPPSSVKVVGQLLRKRFVGKDLVEPYTVQPPTTAPSVFVKVDRKRRKRKARMLEKTHDFLLMMMMLLMMNQIFVLSLWKNGYIHPGEHTVQTSTEKKEPIRQSQIDMKDIPLVEFHENFSRAPYSQRTKVKLPDCIDTVYALDADGKFEMLYVGFRCAIRSFLRYMRPLIIIDGAHLKGNYLGTNLPVVGMDGNNQILPLLQVCLRACKDYTTKDFNKAISELRGHRSIAITKLEEVGIEKWSRAYCPTSRYNYMTSNIVESINSLSRIVRRVPVTMLVEYCRDLLQMWYCEKRHKYEEAHENELSDWAAEKVYDKILKSANWTVRPIDHLKLFKRANEKRIQKPKERPQSSISAFQS
uniref:Transposase, MuDR, MULE transposase domain protein n=1 Tax=Tanacetum cinerariifolium TaxID=118510 RepID=A0A6L2M1F1_TANCI|nr:transposase, MuDR, MULE transposase domain protein [Tanacetum cinerariifolium]